MPQRQREGYRQDEEGPLPIEKERSLGGGWRVKERKTKRPLARDQQISAPLRPESHDSLSRSVSPTGKMNAVRRQQWLLPIGGLAAVSAVIVTIMMSGVPSSSSDQSGGLQLVSADRQISAQSQRAAAQESMMNVGYMLHLGSYQSELGAHLMWTGLEANTASMLEGLDPIFKSQQRDDRQPR